MSVGIGVSYVFTVGILCSLSLFTERPAYRLNEHLGGARHAGYGIDVGRLGLDYGLGQFLCGDGPFFPIVVFGGLFSSISAEFLHGRIGNPTVFYLNFHRYIAVGICVGGALIRPVFQIEGTLFGLGIATGSQE